MKAILAEIDVNAPIPTDEHSKQYYYMKKMQSVLVEEEQKLGRKVTACINTFGCQMNANPVKRNNNLIYCFC